MNSSTLRPKELSDYFSMIRERLPLFLGCILSCTLFFFAISLLGTNEYTATARVSQENKAAQETFFRSSDNAGIAERTVANEIIYATGDEVRAKVGSTNQDIRIEVLKDETNEESDVLLFRAKASTSDKAAADANLWAQSYVETKNQQRTNNFEIAIKELETELNVLLSQQKLDTPNFGIEQSITDIRTNISQLQLAKSLTKSGVVQIVQIASPPSSTSTVKLSSMTFMGVAFGLIIGFAAVLATDHLDTSIKKSSDIEDIGVPVIAVIPPDPAVRKEDMRLCTINNRNSQMAEHYFKLRTTISHIQEQHNISSLLITSPNPKEGKTCTALNLALATSYLDKRVVLLDTNSKNPQIHVAIHSPQAPGLAEFLSADSSISLKKIAVRLEALENNLILLPAGERLGNANDALASTSFSNLLKNLAVQSDLSILDAPHLTSDALTLAAKTDATLLTVRAGKTTRADADAAISALSSVGANIVGICLIGSKDISVSSTPIKLTNATINAGKSKNPENFAALPEQAVIDLVENI